MAANAICHSAVDEQPSSTGGAPLPAGDGSNAPVMRTEPEEEAPAAGAESEPDPEPIDKAGQEAEPAKGDDAGAPPEGAAPLRKGPTCR